MLTHIIEKVPFVVPQRHNRKNWRQLVGHNTPTPFTDITPEIKKKVLSDALERCFFKKGDHVTFKKPKRNRIRGVIRDLETDPQKVSWAYGKPLYMIVDVTDSSGKITTYHTYDKKVIFTNG